MTNRSVSNNGDNSHSGPGERIVSELRKAHRGVHALFSRLSETHGVTMPQVIVLKTLAKAGHPLTLVELASQLDLAKSTVSVEVDRMVRAGYLRREPDPDCRRQVNIELAPGGRTLLDAGLPSLTARITERLAALPPEEAGAIERGLAALNRLLAECVAVD